MHFNYFFLKKLSASLNKRLIGCSLNSCFSQNRNELIFEFSLDKSSFFIKVTFDGAISLLSFPYEFARARKNSVDLFPKIIGTTVHKVVQHKNERAFSIYLDHDFILLFKLFGRQSNILLFEHSQFSSMFKKNLKNDENLEFDNLDRELDQSEEALIACGHDLRSIFPTFDKTILRELDQRGYENQKGEMLNEMLNDLDSGNFFVGESSIQLPKLTLFELSGYERLHKFNEAIEAANFFSNLYIKQFHFEKEKSKLKTAIEKDLKKSHSYVHSNQAKLEELVNGRKYKEIADILMANLNSLATPVQKSIALFDFYENKEIKIKINPNLSLQKNAENYYRKGKNQKIELKKLTSNIREKKKLVEDLNSKLAALNLTSEFKDLKAFSTEKKKKSAKTKDISLPYFHQVVCGYDVFIGKNAKNNDILTQKVAAKNDLWLHAKDVPGSHVVIKSKGNDQYPKHVIEKVAQLAAWYSKRKNDTLCPVIYTLKKYVNKPKGATPGLVKLLREEVILVRPNKTVA